MGNSARSASISALASAEMLGATALAAGTAHVLAGVPLPATFRRAGSEVVLDGRIPWASNLIPPFVVVTAAGADDGSGAAVVVAIVALVVFARMARRWNDMNV